MFNRIKKILNSEKDVKDLEIKEKIELLKKYKQLKIDHKRKYNIYKELEKDIIRNLEKDHNVYVSVEYKDNKTDKINTVKEKKENKPKTPVEKVRQEMVKAKNINSKKNNVKIFGSGKRQHRKILRIVENNKYIFKELKKKSSKNTSTNNKAKNTNTSNNKAKNTSTSNNKPKNTSTNNKPKNTSTSNNKAKNTNTNNKAKNTSTNNKAKNTSTNNSKVSK